MKEKEVGRESLSEINGAGGRFQTCEYYNLKPIDNQLILC